MRVLVVYGSKRGGTAGIARIIGGTLRGAGMDADVRSGDEATGVADYEAVIVGGALYANRWHRHARRFVKLHAKELRDKPVWLFSSGPLGHAENRREDRPPVKQVQRLLHRIGARGHVTFGGRLEKNARGLLASRMAKTRAGDWRNPERIRRWALDVAQQLRPQSSAQIPRGAPEARPHP
ncbi:MAG: flavodoxin domain-containing protein [Myxococcales bacterium]|jgi:menaquinone-dependent protoporphyrinogen oxidase